MHLGLQGRSYFMEVSATYQGGVKFEVLARGHRVLCDQPHSNAGNDEGMSPPEFLLASLATCAGYYAVQYLKTRGMAPADVSVKVSARKALQPARLAAFDIEVSVPHLGEGYEAGLLRAVKTCLIHNTLLNEPAIEVRLARPAYTIGTGSYSETIHSDTGAGNRTGGAAHDGRRECVRPLCGSLPGKDLPLQPADVRPA
jgi:uncharacterized OsmC-like protein